MELMGAILKTGEIAAETAEKAEELASEVTSTTGELSVQAIDGVMNSDGLAVTDGEIDNLLKRAVGVERAERKDLSFTGVKICATRHGCTGATNCDHAYGAPIGRK